MVEIGEVEAELMKAVHEQVAKMRTRSSLKAMDYFYDSAEHMYEVGGFVPSGSRVGVFCNLVPEELILAAGGRPLRICGGFHGTIQISETILPQIYCPLIKSTVGFFMKDMFRDLNLLVVPTTCDGKKKAAEILAEKKTTLIMEVPQSIETPQARELWLKEILTLKKNLGRHLGTKITKKGLKDAIIRTNKKRAALRELYEYRKGPPPIFGSDAMLVAHMSTYDGLDSWTEHVKALNSQLDSRKPVCDDDTPRIMITGSPAILPTWKIPLLIEEAGGVIVTDDLCSGAKTLLNKIEVRSWSMYDMLIGIADTYLMSGCPCFVPNDIRMTRLLSSVEDYRVDGVIHHTLQGCQLYGGEAWRLGRALKEREIPLLKLETSYGEGDIKQLKLRIDAFLEMLIARKED